MSGFVLNVILRMIHYKSAAEIELMRQSALLVGKAHALVAAAIKPGVTTLYLDGLAETFIKDNKATASFKGYNGFPFACCISVNDAVVHGFPSKNELKDGDVVSVDIGVFKNGFHGFFFSISKTNYCCQPCIGFRITMRC